MSAFLSTRRYQALEFQATPRRVVPGVAAAALALAVLGVGDRLAAQDWARAHFAAPPPAEGAGSRPGEEPAALGGLHAVAPGLNRGAGKVGRTANLGPLALSLGAVGSLEYNDNVLVEPDGQAGLTASGGLRFDSSYQVTALQNLSLKGEISQRLPLTGPGRRQQLFTVAPDSALRCNVWIKSLRLSPFIKYSRELDPVISPVVNHTEILDQTAATGGLQADLPMHDAALQVLVLRERRRQRGDQTLNRTTWSNVGSIRAIRNVSATTVLTADLAVVDSRLDNGPSGTSRSVSAGVYDDWRLSALLTTRLGGGLTRTVFRDRRDAADVGATTSPFVQASIDHRLRQNLSYQLHYQRSDQEGVTTNSFRLSEVGLTPKYVFTEVFSVEGSMTYQWIRESGANGEDATRWSSGLALGYALTVNVDARLSYDRVVKQSDRSARDYTQNRIVFLLIKQF